MLKTGHLAANRLHPSSHVPTENIILRFRESNHQASEPGASFHREEIPGIDGCCLNPDQDFVFLDFRFFDFFQFEDIHGTIIVEHNCFGFDLPVPDHTTLSVRGKILAVSLPKKRSSSIHIVVDSTGLKIYGEGEWKTRKHGVSKRRTWRKLHLAVNPEDGQIEAVVLSEADLSDADAVEPMLAEIDQQVETFGGDGAYDKRKVYQKVRDHSPDSKINVPPQKNARIWQHGNCKAPPHPRDENLRYIRKHGRHAWKRNSGYHQRSLSETAMFRIKTIFGDKLSTRLLATQRTQAQIRCRALNIMTHLGMPDSYRVA